ncbi:MAG: hypothetical protein ACKPJD_37135, partial [Planctomycetaceae bacterium]
PKLTNLQLRQQSLSDKSANCVVKAVLWPSREDHQALQNCERGEGLIHSRHTCLPRIVLWIGDRTELDQKIGSLLNLAV